MLVCVHVHAMEKAAPGSRIVLTQEVPPGGCVPINHLDMRQIYFLIQQTFTAEYKDPRNVTLAHDHGGSCKGDRPIGTARWDAGG